MLSAMSEGYYIMVELHRVLCQHPCKH